MSRTALKTCKSFWRRSPYTKSVKIPARQQIFFFIKQFKNHD
eukprot:UN21733